MFSEIIAPGQGNGTWGEKGEEEGTKEEEEEEFANATIDYEFEFAFTSLLTIIECARPLFHH